MRLLALAASALALATPASYLRSQQQPDGGWGWSNAGLITAGGTSLLVDTLFDLRLTREMLDALGPITDAHPIGQAMNTHGNGDHWFGNQLLPDGIPIVASAAVEAYARAKANAPDEDEGRIIEIVSVPKA